MIVRRRGSDIGARVVVGTARVDRRTKDLVKRLEPGDIAVIDHEDLDRVAAEGLVEAQPAAVVNASPSISGAYPNVGPLLVAAAGIPLIDNAGAGVMDAVADGVAVVVDGGRVLIDGSAVATGTRQTLATLEAAYREAQTNVGPALERFIENTVTFVQKEIHLFTRGALEVPDIGVDMNGRHVLIVVRGHDYREDLLLLRQTGYLAEKRPVLVGVDGGADALLELGHKPHLIIGDMDSVSEKALRSGAALVVHCYTDGRAPGAGRLEELGVEFHRFEAPGTSEDIAMLLAEHCSAELIVAVGSHTSMVEFLDKGRQGMASTVLVRMLLGPKLVDAKGVSRLYQSRVRGRDLAGMVLAALFTLGVFTILSEPVRLLLRSLWVRLT